MWAILGCHAQEGFFARAPLRAAQPDVSVSSSAALPKTTFRAEAESCTMPLDELCIKRQVPPCHTTNAVVVGRARAGLHMVRGVMARAAA